MDHRGKHSAQSAHGWIGDYQVIERLGGGRQSEVFLAVDREGRTVVIKALLLERAHDPAARRAFAIEVAAMRAANPAFVPEVIAHDLKGRRPYIVREYLHGPTLEEYLKEHGGFNDRGALRMGALIAGVVADLHGVGISHRNLRSRNIILCSMRPYVIDFGKAVLLPESRDQFYEGCNADLDSLAGLFVELMGDSAWGDDVREAADRGRTGTLDLGGLSGPLRAAAADLSRSEPGWKRPSAASIARRLNDAL